MKEIQNSLKKYLLVKYAENKLNKCSENISQSLPWIQRQSLINTIKTHCKVLLNALINQSENQSLRTNKYIVDSIFKYTLGKSENLLKTNKKASNIKTYMQLNSYIVYDEITKGIASHKNRKAIRFNIEKQLSDVQDRINSKENIEDILNNRITA